MTVDLSARARRLAVLGEHALSVRDRWPLHGMSPLRVDRDIQVSGEVPSGLLVATSAAGLLHLRDGRPARLMDGSWYYGLTYHDEHWYGYERTGRHGRIKRFRLDRPAPVRTSVWGLHFGVHQIDIVDGRLLVADAHHNRLLGYPTGALRRPRLASRAGLRALPAGPLANGRHSANYAHFNSVFATGGTLYLVAHNDKKRTGRDSELYLLDRQLSVREVLPLGGANCHNFCRYRPDPDGPAQQVHLRSDAGEVVVDGAVAYRCGEFLRGLAVGREYQLVGTSQLRGPSRHAGGDPGRGGVLVFDRSWRRVGTVTIPATQVFEVRLTDEPDRAMSVYANG